MSITWRRLGFLGFMIPLALWGLAAVMFGHSNFNAFRVAFVIAAIVVWFVGMRLNAEVVDDDGKAPHLAFGLPMQQAGVIVCAIGFVLTMM
jgi:hypothetical protein